MPEPDSGMASSKEEKPGYSSEEEEYSEFDDVVSKDEPLTMCIEPDTFHLALSNDEMDSYHSSDVGSPGDGSPLGENSFMKYVNRASRSHRYTESQNLVISEAFDDFIEGRSAYPPMHDVECFLVLYDFIRGEDFDEQKKSLRIKLYNMRRLHKMKSDKSYGRKPRDPFIAMYKKRTPGNRTAPSRYRLYTVEENSIIHETFSGFIESTAPYPSREDVEVFLLKHNFIYGATYAEQKTNLRTKLNNARRLYRDHRERFYGHQKTNHQEGTHSSDEIEKLNGSG